MLSDLFYTINFIVSIITSIICLIFAFLFIIIVIINKQCHTIANLLICNTIVAIICYTIIVLLSNSFSLRGDWLYYQPVCTFRAYCFITFCGTIYYSYLIQAISRLNFVVFYKYKYLQSYRVHWILIIINWLISISIPLVMFLINHNIFILEKESRFCIATSTILITSMYGIVSVYIIPLNIIAIIYGIILHRARQSTRRIVAVTSNSTINRNVSNKNTMNIKRELRLMRNMMILLSYYTCAESPRFILIVWPILFKVLPPEPLYLISLNSITINVDCMMMITFFMSKDVKKYFYEIFKKIPI